MTVFIVRIFGGGRRFWTDCVRENEAQQVKLHHEIEITKTHKMVYHGTQVAQDIINQL
jgi:hypothetical protein